MGADIYLDNAATTPVRQEVIETLLDSLPKTFGNASSIHSFGQDAKRLLEESRERLGTCIGASAEEVIFTGGGTESDNLALRGAAYALRDRGNHIITTGIEHHAVLNCCKDLESEGFDVTYLPVNRECRLDPQWLVELIKPETTLVSVMFANNETGSLQPLEDVGRITGEKGIVFHTDAVQALGKVPVDVDRLGVDLLSMSAHKIYGPKGVGALYIRKGTPIQPIVFGGSHEKGLRPGTENVPGIAAFATAAELAVSELEDSDGHIRGLREKLASGVEKGIRGVHRNGNPESSLPNILNMSFEGVDGESLLLNLDLLGIAVSTGSACTSGATEPSHVLTAMGLSPLLAQGSLRFSFGRENTSGEVDRVLEVLPDVVSRLRKLSTIKISE